MLAVTASTLICAGIGFGLEYVLLSQFGLNIGTFASVEYFLLAGITSPEVVLLFAALLVGGFFRLRIVEKTAPKRTKERWYYVLLPDITGVFIIGATIFAVFTIAEQKHKKIVENPTEFAAVTLRTGSMNLVPDKFDLTLITATDTFMLFYQHSTESVYAAPIENILYVNIIHKNDIGNVPE
ncbi:hypothetical protein CRN41_08165 [Vibrio vulnificus]|nr:hypothetical protein CRN41_08165 [Vibrio vulnificus]